MTVKNEYNDYQSLVDEIKHCLETADGQQICLTALHSEFSLPIHTVERDKFGRIWVRGRQPGGIVCSVAWAATTYYLELKKVGNGSLVAPTFLDRTKNMLNAAIHNALEQNKL
ncbi:hypothetical protein D9X30_5718 [Cupriavidus sp. U2]|nr:hypothetical protein D9X30_5718 [Cupriavidus sp. U2]